MQLLCCRLVSGRHVLLLQRHCGPESCLGKGAACKVEQCPDTLGSRPVLQQAARVSQPDMFQVLLELMQRAPLLGVIMTPLFGTIIREGATGVNAGAAYL